MNSYIIAPEAISDLEQIIDYLAMDNVNKGENFLGVADVEYEFFYPLLKSRLKLAFRYVQCCYSYLNSATPFYRYLYKCNFYILHNNSSIKVIISILSSDKAIF